MSKLVIHKSPQEYLDSNYSYLIRSEAENNLTLGIPLGLDKKNIENPESRFISVSDNNKTEAVSVNISPRMMISSNQDSEEAVKMISEYFNDSDYPVKSIIGKKGIPEIFAKNFDEKIRSVRDLVLHQLTGTSDIPLSKGKLETADLKDLKLLAKFRYEFDMDTFGSCRSSENEIIKETESNIVQKNLFVWKVNSELVAMAKIMRSTVSRAIIGRVFTPKEFRGKGYGTSIVHSLSNEILNRGLPVCTLFTDKLNLTSAKIYYNVGYRPEMEFSDIYFDN